MSADGGEQAGHGMYRDTATYYAVGGVLQLKETNKSVVRRWDNTLWFSFRRRSFASLSSNQAR